MMFFQTQISKENQDLILAVCAGFPDRDPENTKLRDQGWKQYFYTKNKGKLVVNKAAKKVRLSKEADVGEAEDCADIQEAMKRSVADPEFGEWDGSGSSRDPPNRKKKQKDRE